MKTLPDQPPTAEQLKIIQNTKPGVSVIRGAAGSGKTTTALLRLRQLVGFWLNRRARGEHEGDVRVLVATYNRTLRGYVETLARRQVAGKLGLDLTISTFAKLCREILPPCQLVEPAARKQKLAALCAPLPLDNDFLIGEVDYAMCRFLPNEIDEYVGCERTGRGTTPRVARATRERLINEVIKPFQIWKRERGLKDWNDLAVEAAQLQSRNPYEIIIVDESQDLSANEVRGILNLTANPSSTTFILDAAQRIYPRGFTWREVNLDLRPENFYRLAHNHRNTVEICQFAKPILDGMEIGDDGTFPDFDSCDRHGPKPEVLKGKYSRQLAHALAFITNEVNLAEESVVFLKPQGGNWFSTLKAGLTKNSLAYVEITRQSEWPAGSENIALSTMHSAKGLEFDHVIILGLNAQVTPLGQDEDDDDSNKFRRLLAMAATRARKTVMLGYKPSEKSQLISYLDPETFTEVDV